LRMKGIVFGYIHKKRRKFSSLIFFFFIYFLFVSNVLVTASTSVCASMCVYMFAVVE